MSGSGAWLVNDKIYFEYAHVLLVELEVVVAEVNKQWPKPLTEAVKRSETTASHWNLARKRDLLQDSIKIFTAMSVEAFLNFCGVLRLGQSGFEDKLERLGPVAKLRKVFELCDEVRLSDSEPIVQTLDKIATRRNRLVHPGTTEVQGYVPAVERGGDKIPEVAREAVADMVRFFEEFRNTKPDTAHHLPPPYNPDA